MADAVRTVDASFGLSASAAHWMAIRAMDQYAEALVDAIPRGHLVRDRDGIGRALDAGEVPVLAPHEWVRQQDPLPHTWAVTADSIAAWVAGEVRAERLILVKAPGATGTLVDDYFSRVLPPTVACMVVDGGDAAGLATAMIEGGHVAKQSGGRAAIVVYQKPTCTTCRQVHAALKEAGVDFEVVDYYTEPIPKAKLLELLRKMNMAPRDLLRTREDVYKTLKLAERELSDAEIVELLVKHPDLIQRPIVEKGAKAILARPATRLSEIL
jgi:arsenate reductase